MTDYQERLKQLEIHIENSGDDHEAGGILQDMRECIAAWMIDHSFATGHGDTITGLLDELSAQINELRGTIEDIKTLGTIPAEDVANFFLENEKNNPFSPMSRQRLARNYKHELSTDSEIEMGHMHARLTEVIRRARVDGANSVNGTAQ